jgi:hypothetical protein
VTEPSADPVAEQTAESEVRRLEAALRREREEHSVREVQARRELEGAHAVIRGMESSLVWRAGRRVYRIRDLLLPPGSSRRRLVARLARRGQA